MYNNYGDLVRPDPNIPDPFELPPIATLPDSPVCEAVHVRPELIPNELNKRWTQLDSEINGLHPSWQTHLKIPLTHDTLISLDFKSLYPLPHHQEALALWRMRNPTGNSPGTGFDLLNTKGNIGDNEHPPHELFELIAATINGSPNKALTSREIRLSLMIRYTHFVYQDFQWHRLVTATLRNNPEYFSSVPRAPTAYDPGNAWKLQDVSPNKLVYKNWRPLNAIEPPVHISYPIQLGPETRTRGVGCVRVKISRLRLNPISIETAGRITLPPFDTLDLEDKKKTAAARKTKKGGMPGTLSEKEVRTSRTVISRRSLDAEMKQRGLDLLKEWENSTANNV